MDSTLNYLLKRDGDERDGKELDFCGPLHRSGHCNYINCSYSVDHYHCQICGSGSMEVSQALYHLRTSPTCRRDAQGPHLAHLNESTSSPSSTSSLHANANAYNAFYGSLTSQNSLCSSSTLSGSYSGYSQLDSFQWHPSVPVDKMAMCAPQLSPCLNASNSSRIPIDSTICSPISDLYSKAPAPVKELASLPAKSSGTPSESQSWFYNNQSMQLYKYVEQTSVPQINFLLLDPPTDHKDTISTDLLPYSYSNKTDWNPNQRDKESFLPFCSQQSLQPVSSEDSASLFNLQIQDDNLSSKQADLFSNDTMGAASACAPECRSKNKDANCCMLIAQTSVPHNSDLTSFAAFQSADITDGNLSDEEHSSSGSESDIIVEDTTDQLGRVGQTQVSIESIKCSLLEEVENVRHDNSESFSSLAMNIAKSSVPVPIEGNFHCGICSDTSPGSSLIRLGNQLPVTLSSHSPVLLKLSQLVDLSEDEVMKTIGNWLCQRCLSLINVVDSLESQLESARQNILIMMKVAVKTNGVIVQESDVDLSTLPHQEKHLQNEVISSEPEVSKVDASLITNHQDELVKSFPGEESSAGENAEAFVEEQRIEETRAEQETQDKEKYDFVCAQCGDLFSSEQQFSLHSALHKQCDTKFLCEICGRRLQYRHQHQIDQHLSQHFPISRFSCQNCDKIFKSKRALKEHSKVHSGARPFSCPNCDRRFAHSSNMRAHFKLCSGNLPYRCDKCKAGFSVVARLERHVAVAHTHTGLAAFKCSQCNRTFSKLSDFRAHQRVHSTLRIFSCPVCDRSYKSRSNLNQHAKSHRKEKPFSCHICGQGFVRKDSWESHMLSHKNERPFKCTECPKAFWSKENLSMHLKRHTGAHKKTRCPVCEKSFSQKLSVHMRTHTGDRPYRCNKCDKAFVTGSTLNKHVLRKHSNSQDFV